MDLRTDTQRFRKYMARNAARAKARLMLDQTLLTPTAEYRAFLRAAAEHCPEGNRSLVGWLALFAAAAKGILATVRNGNLSENSDTADSLILAASEAYDSAYSEIGI